LTWAEFARSLARSAGFDAGLIEARPTKSLRLDAARPRYCALTSERGQLLPPLETAVGRYLRESSAPASPESAQCQRERTG
jgi:dTDP-4-dehydrorhamnose reductase